MLKNTSIIFHIYFSKLYIFQVLETTAKLVYKGFLCTHRISPITCLQIDIFL